MSEHEPEDTGAKSGPGDVGDDKLPEDLRPTEDNPLARHPGQTGDDDDRIGADTEGGDAANPSTNITYGSGPDDNDIGDGDIEGGDIGGGGIGDTPDAEEDDGSSTLDNGGGGAG